MYVFKNIYYIFIYTINYFTYYYFYFDMFFFLHLFIAFGPPYRSSWNQQKHFDICWLVTFMKLFLFESLIILYSDISYYEYGQDAFLFLQAAAQ